MAKDEEKTREWILERTTERFLSEGFSRFTMDEIAGMPGSVKKPFTG
jgi:AcrR family transcriptional regulator